MAVVVIVVPPACAFRHDCAPFNPADLWWIIPGTFAAIAAMWGLLCMAAWISERMDRRWRRNRW